MFYWYLFFIVLMMNELIDELVDECLFKILQQQGFILAIKGGKYGKE